jgi:hypothetical protein
MAQLYLTSKELSVSGYVRASAETEAGKGGVWLHRWVHIFGSMYRKHGEALLVPRKSYQYLAMSEHQLTEAGKRVRGRKHS